ncbi:DUF4062 domain-containing protein [Klebsiella sp. 141251]|uniref:DUF4062 domain-containing protein n=1 Tax=Klebsiella sp. 141251 TaxID=3020030 RepID=UPI003D348685
MSISRKIVRVFIASPGDLGAERHIARDVAFEINQLLGDTFSIQLEMVGWEETIGSMGRPQELINKDLKRCELFIGIIWKRWGTPPDLNGKYSSGFEEEFYLAKELYSEGKKPQLSMFFKDVSDDLMRDPGADLQKVINFKNELIAQKEILFMTFSDEKAFEKKLRKILTSYITDLYGLELSQQEDNITQSQSEFNVANEPLKPLEDKYFKSETINFLKSITNSLEFNGIDELSSHQIAFLRLLSISMRKGGNSDSYLDAHDANLIYLNANQYVMGGNEKGGLILSGINNFDDHNVPLWKWIEIDKDEANLEIYSIITKDKNRVNAINAMITLNQPLSNTFSREYLLKNWFGDDNIKAVKTAALHFLSLFGTAEDIVFIESEIQKNDPSTNDLAIEAMISILLKDSTVDAFDMILKYQPASLNENIIKSFADNAFHLSLEQLKKAIVNRCNLVRIMAYDIIKKDYGFDESLRDYILQSEHMDIKFKMLIDMAEDDFINARALANTWLVYKDDKGKVRTEQYDKFVTDTMYHEDREVIERIYKDEFRFDGVPLLSLAKKGIDKYITEVKTTLEDGCENHFKYVTSKYNQGLGDNFSSIFDKIKGGVQQDICVLYADWIASKKNKSDIHLIRSYLKNENSLISSNIISYFSRFGEWCDVNVLVNYDKSSKWSIKKHDSNPSKLKNMLCQTIIKLSGVKISELLEMHMGEDLRKSIIAKISKAGINRLSIDQVVNLMNSDNSKTREAMCLKYINCVSKEKIIQVQNIILEKDTYYYNVVHWLDLGVSLKKEWSQNATNRLLSLL